MKTTFLKSTSNFGCYKTDGNRQNDHLKNETFTIDDVLNADVRLKDKAWFIRHNCELTQDEFRQFAIDCALCVLPIYEKKYPGNNAPREAIEAAKAYLAGTMAREDLDIKRKNAAYAYAAAAYAADAADAAAYAADAADAAADAIDYRLLLLEFFKEFTTVKETATS